MKNYLARRKVLFFLKLFVFFIFIYIPQVFSNPNSYINTKLIPLKTTNIVNSVMDKEHFIYTLSSDGVFRYDGKRSVNISSLYNVLKSLVFISMSIDKEHFFLFLQTKKRELIQINLITREVVNLGVLLVTEGERVKVYVVGNHFVIQSYSHLYWADFSLKVFFVINTFDSFKGNIKKSFRVGDKLYLTTTKGVYSVDLFSQEVVSLYGNGSDITAFEISGETSVYVEKCKIILLYQGRKIVRSFPIQKSSTKDCRHVEVAFIGHHVFINKPNNGMYLWDFNANKFKAISLMVNDQFKLSVFEHLTISSLKEGLILNVDDMGIILLPLDQLSFEYMTQLSTGSSTGSINSVEVDAKDRMWIALNSGLSLVNKDLKVIEEVALKYLPKNFDFFDDSENNVLWFFSKKEKKLYRYDKKLKEITMKENPAFSSLFKHKKDFYISLEENMFQSGVLYKLNRKGGLGSAIIHFNENENLKSIKFLDDFVLILQFAQKIEIYKEGYLINTIALSDFYKNKSFSFFDLIVIDPYHFLSVSKNNGIINFELDKFYNVENSILLELVKQPVLSGIVQVKLNHKDKVLYVLNGQGLYGVNLETFETKLLISKNSYFSDSFKKMAMWTNDVLVLLNKKSMAFLDTGNLNIRKEQLDFTVSMFDIIKDDKFENHSSDSDKIIVNRTELLNKVYLTTLNPFESRKLDFTYRLNKDEEWLPVSDDLVISLVGHPKKNFTLYLKGSFEGTNEIQHDYKVVYDVYFYQTAVFRKVLIAIFVIFFILITGVYLFILKRRLTFAQKFRVLNKAYERSDIKQFVLSKNLIITSRASMPKEMFW